MKLTPREEQMLKKHLDLLQTALIDKKPEVELRRMYRISSSMKFTALRSTNLDGEARKRVHAELYEDAKQYSDFYTPVGAVQWSSSENPGAYCTDIIGILTLKRIV